MLPDPLFTLGSAVYEKLPFASTRPERGFVIERYELEGEYRYIVKFESGREAVFFERELISAPSKPSESDCS